MNADALNVTSHYATQDELDYLRRIAATLAPMANVVMLGAGPGVMMLAALEGNYDIRATIYDRDTCEWAQRHIQEAGFTWSVTYRCMDSAHAGRQWDGGDVELLIVDADHSERGVMRDYVAWSPHCTRYIFFHDYDASGTEFEKQEQYPGVKQAVDKILKTDEWLMARIGTAALLERIT